MGSLRRKVLDIQTLQHPHFRSWWGCQVDAVGLRLSGTGNLLPWVTHVVVVSAGIWHPGSVFALLLLFLLIHLPQASPSSAKRCLQAVLAIGLQESAWPRLFLSNMLLLSQAMDWSIPEPVPWM